MLRLLLDGKVEGWRRSSENADYVMAIEFVGPASKALTREERRCTEWDMGLSSCRVTSENSLAAVRCRRSSTSSHSEGVRELVASSLPHLLSCYGLLEALVIGDG